MNRAFPTYPLRSFAKDSMRDVDRGIGMVRLWRSHTWRYVAVSIALAHAAVSAQTSSTPSNWVFAAIGAGGNAITDPSNRLKGTPQGVFRGGLAFSRERLGVELDASLSREIDYIVGDCIGVSPATCYASPFDLVGSSLGLVLPIRGDLRPEAHSIHVGIGGYHMPRSYSRNGNLAAQTTVGFHAGIEGAAWRWPGRAVMLSGRAVVLPRLHERRAWMANVALGYRAGF
jgi:hypothetical protein